jgi:hypothetical protein
MAWSIGAGKEHPGCVTAKVQRILARWGCHLGAYPLARETRHLNSGFSVAVNMLIASTTER